MDHASATSLIRRTLDHLAGGTTDMQPAGHARPISFYADAERFARERAILFRSFPVAIRFSADMAKPGDFVTHDLSGVPLVAVRGRDGVLRAFVNACRHRGTRVEWETCGRGERAFICPYHAWTYGDDGALAHIPHEEGFAGLDRATHGLVPVRTTEHAGLVWAVPDPAWRGDTSSTLTPLFLDTMCVFDRLGMHQHLFLAKRTIETLRGTDPAGWRIRDHGSPLYFFFPGTVVLLDPDHAQVAQMWPAAPDRTIVTGATLIPETPKSDKARAHWDKNEQIFWGTLREDFALMESKQSTLGAGANTELVFGRFEHSAAWFHEAVDAGLAGGVAGAPELANGA